MRQKLSSYSVIACTFCGILLTTAVIRAQDNSGSNPFPSATEQETDPADDQQQSFQQIVDEVRKNERQINKLFSSIPIGFPSKQAEYMSRIDALKKTNEVLKSRMNDAALKSFQLEPNKNRQATQLVYNMLVRKLEATAANPEFDPKGALDIAEMMLKTDLNNNPRSPVRAEDVAYQGFLASYALEDFSRAESMLRIIEDLGIPLQPSLKNELADSQRKQERELMIRQLESSADDLPRVKFETSEGDFIVELFENHAPQTVGNFISLVEKKFYDDLAFFLVQPGRIAQTGCPVGDGTGDAGYKIPCEYDRDEIRHHFTGTLSMANTGLDTGGSQFFITHTRNGNFDGKYTAFGRVIEGLDVVYRLKIADGSRPGDLESSAAPEPSIIRKATVLRKRNHPYSPTRVAKNPSNETDPGQSVDPNRRPGTGD